MIRRNQDYHMRVVVNWGRNLGANKNMASIVYVPTKGSERYYLSTNEVTIFMTKM